MSHIWIIKIGSSLLINENRQLNEALIAGYARQLANLAAKHIQTVLVSSGAVAMGSSKLSLSVPAKKQPIQKTTRPQGGAGSSKPNLNARSLQDLQVAAAVGQIGLMSAYERIFSKNSLTTAQVLLTHNDMRQRTSYLNARATLNNLLNLGIVPIVNENDTVMVEELCFGDNDQLAAMVANLLSAVKLIILTDRQGLYDEDPQVNPHANLIEEIYAEDERLNQIASSKSGEMGRGGMSSKIKAARLAAHAGTHTILAAGSNPAVLTQIEGGANPGTVIRSRRETSAARKRWLAGQLGVHGRLHLDKGAVNALRQRGVSLLPVGILKAEGNFERGDLVSCLSPMGKEVARGLVNYGAAECNKICGKPTSAIATILGYKYEEELVHRDNLVLTD